MEPKVAKKVARRWPLVSGSVALVLAVGLGLLIMERSDNLPLSFDSEWMEEIVEGRSLWLEVPALLLDWLGGGIVGVFVVPIGIIVALCLFKKFWAALFFALTAVLSAGLVQLLKGTFSRARPEDILVMADVGSFPSGHVANAATMGVALALIFGRTWIWFGAIVYTVLMALSRTYLGAHWLSDTLGGALLGAAVAVIVWAPFAHKLLRERERGR